MPSSPVKVVSIVILNWNGKDIMQKCLPSVLATQYPNFEIIIVDNASTDDSVAWLRANYPQIKIHVEAENGGFSKGNNAGIALANGKYVVLLNNDVEVTPNWLDAMVALMEQEPKVAAVQPKMLQYEKRDTFEYAGACGGMLDKYGYGFARGRFLSKVEKDKGQYDQSVEICWACGAAILIRKSAINDLKEAPLDPLFFMHFEEIDLCWRLQRAGWQIKVVPQSVVYHIGGASLNQGNPKKTYYNFRNSLLTLYKNYTPKTFQQIYKRRWAIDRLAILSFLLKGDFKQVKAILQAYRDFKQLKSQVSKPPHVDVIPNALLNRSILWQYFKS